MHELKTAIDALELAKRNGGQLDLEICAKAFEGLVALRNRILRYDKKLDDAEVAPTGDDYNEIFEMLGLVGERPDDDVFIGKLWWVADNRAEAEQWQRDYLSKGAISVDLKPETDRPAVRVIITLDRSRASEILGVEVDAAEWLDMSKDDPSTMPSLAKEMPEKVYVVFGSDAISPLVNEGKVTEAVLHGFNEFEFPSKNLAEAFLSGVENGCGWLEYHIPEDFELKKIQSKLKRKS